MSYIALNHINSPTWTPLKSWESLLRSVWLGCWKNTPLWLGCSKNYISKCPAKFNRNPGYKIMSRKLQMDRLYTFYFQTFSCSNRLLGNPVPVLWGYDRTFCRSKFTHPYGSFQKWWYPTTMGFPTKNDHFGMFWGYHYFRKHPYCFQGKIRKGQRIGQTIQFCIPGPSSLGALDGSF